MGDVSIRYRRYDDVEKHPVYKALNERRYTPGGPASYAIWQFFDDKSAGVHAAESMTIAYDGDKIVGVHLFNYNESIGTYVIRAYRRLGIGAAMWQRSGLLKKRTTVHTASRQGTGLVRYLAAKTRGRVTEERCW